MILPVRERNGLAERGRRRERGDAVESSRTKQKSQSRGARGSGSRGQAKQKLSRRIHATGHASGFKSTPVCGRQAPVHNSSTRRARPAGTAWNDMPRASRPTVFYCTRLKVQGCVAQLNTSDTLLCSLFLKREPTLLAAARSVHPQKDSRAKVKQHSSHSCCIHPFCSLPTHPTSAFPPRVPCPFVPFVMLHVRPPLLLPGPMCYISSPPPPLHLSLAPVLHLFSP